MCVWTGLVTITSTAECFEASKALGRTPLVRTTSGNGSPWGCYYVPLSSKNTYVNTNAVNTAHRKATAAYQSLCAGETNV